MYKDKNYSKKYYIKNKIKIKQYAVNYYYKTREKQGYHSEQDRVKECVNCHEIFLATNITSLYCYKKECRGAFKKMHRIKYSLKNKDKILKYQKEYRSKYRKNRKYTIRERLDTNIARAINKGLKKQRKSWKKYVNYSLKDLILRLECQFTKGMSWDNYGKWHIDHKKPKSLFKYNSMDDISFKNCWMLANLQPLWAADNIKKSNKF